MSYNKVILIGRVGKDAEVKTFDWGTVAECSLATSKKWKDKQGNLKESTQWHSLEFFGKTAEVAGKYVKKGSQIQVEGRIEYQEYEKDGQKRTITEIVVGSLLLLGSKQDDQANDDLPFQ